MAKDAIIVPTIPTIERKEIAFLNSTFWFSFYDPPKLLFLLTMHVKLALAAAAVASASAFTLQNEGIQSGQGMTSAQEYAIRNMDEICFSTRPVQMCQEDYVVKSYKNQKVNFHCLNRNSVEGQRLKQKVENDEVIPEMNGKTTHVQGRVQVPTKCVEKSQVRGQEQRRRQQQQQHGQRVELIEEGQQQQYDQENSWETEEDQLTHDEQYNQYRQHRHHEEKEWQKMQSLFQQYPQLSEKKLRQMVKADEGKYQEVADQLRELVQQKKVTGHLETEIQNNLPTFFSEVAKQLYEAMKEQQEQIQSGKQDQRMTEQGQQRLDQLVGNYQQYKQLMKRVYVYIVKEALKLNQQAPRRLANTPELVRKVWEKTQRHELSKKQIQKVEQIMEQAQELLELDQTNQLIADELVSDQLKSSQKQARRNLMRIIVTGLMMENTPSQSGFEQNY